MRSLRWRLILGVSLLTLIPLAITIAILTQRVQTMVRNQGMERLSDALDGIRNEISADGARVSEQLRILARDPELKRLYLLRPNGSRDLTEYLGERQFLLGLDFLALSDTTGTWIASSSDRGDESGEVSPHSGGSADSDAPRIEALSDQSGLAMIAGAPIRYQNLIAGRIRGGLYFDSLFVVRLGRVGGIDLVLQDGQGRYAASTLAEPPRTRVSIAGRVVLDGRSYLSRSVRLEGGSSSSATAIGLISSDRADRTLRSLGVASALLALLGLAIATLLGILWSSQISRPVERIAAFSERLARGEWDEPLTIRSVRELETLVSALDRMRLDLLTYRGKLVTSERHAAWGQMAQKVAHEIKNPLTPIAISVSDLKRSYDLKRPDFPEILDQAVLTVSEEVETLRKILQEFSEFARFPAPVFAPCGLSTLLAELEALYAHEVAQNRLIVQRPAREVTLSCDRGQIRQALINLVQNGLDALDGSGSVGVSVAESGGWAEITVSDSGRGLTPAQRASLFVPGFTTKSQGSGLGLTIVERIVHEHGGTITVDPDPGRGTTFRIRLPLEQKGGSS